LENSWEYALEKACRAKVSLLEAELADGRAEDYAAYRYLCGQIRGIHFAVDQLIGLRERAGNQEDQEWKDV
jgi:hypothetical protein